MQVQSQILQVDGNISNLSQSSQDSIGTDDSIVDYDTDEKVDPEVIAADLSPVVSPSIPDTQPRPFQVNNPTNYSRSSFIPLCLIMNCRSLMNKADRLSDMMRQICPDLILASETWERQNKRLGSLIKNKNFKYVSFYRKNKSPGGGCAIIYNESRFSISDPEIIVPENIEAVWCLLTPQVSEKQQKMKVKRIAIGSIYVSPRSKHKGDIIEHIIETIHVLRAKHDNEINFLIGGDFHRLQINDILDCYGGLRQLVSIPTRKSAILEIVLTDLHSFFHPPTTIMPLEVDEDKSGKNSDHDIVVLAPKSNGQYKIDRKMKIIKTRPLPESLVQTGKKW